MWFSECLPVDPRFFSAFWSSLCCIFSGYRPVVPLGRWPVGAMAEIVVCSATSGEELVTLKLEDLEQDSRNDVTPCDSLILFIYFFSG